MSTIEILFAVLGILWVIAGVILKIFVKKQAPDVAVI